MYNTAHTATGTPPLWFYFGTFVVVSLIFFAVTYGPVIENKFKAMRRRVKDLGQPSDKDVRNSETLTQYHCAKSCGKGPFPKVHDKELHEEAKHGINHGHGRVKKDLEEKQVSRNKGSTSKTRLRDFVDKSKTPDWLKSLREKSDDGITLQKPEGGKDRELEAERLRKCWKPILSRLEEKGVVEIGRNEHPLGSKGPRGPDAARLFAQQSKRMDLNFDVDVELGKPSIITKK